MLSQTWAVKCCRSLTWGRCMILFSISDSCNSFDVIWHDTSTDNKCPIIVCILLHLGVPTVVCKEVHTLKLSSNLFKANGGNRIKRQNFSTLSFSRQVLREKYRVPYRRLLAAVSTFVNGTKLNLSLCNKGGFCNYLSNSNSARMAFTAKPCKVIFPLSSLSSLRL